MCLIKHQTALSLAYGTGLRVGEVVALKVGYIDSKRMTLRVEQGKGLKDRYAMLSPVLLERLRVGWRVARAQGKMLDGGWLFPGLDPLQSLSTRQLNRAIHDAATKAKIDKRVQVAPAAVVDPKLTDECAEPVRPSFVCTHCGAPMVIFQTFLRAQAIRAPPTAQGPP